FNTTPMKHHPAKKRRILVYFIFLLLSTAHILAKNVIITDPVYEFSTSGITNITKIELNKEETRVHIHSTFIPHWRVKFSKKDFIQDCETGEKFYATGIENGEFDKEIHMPASGDSTFVLIFPPLNKSVRKINLGDNDVVIIFGVSLNPKEKPKNIERTPQYVLDWVNEEVEKSKNKEAGKLSAEEFFSSQPAKIVGYIKGYDKRSGFSTGIIYANNVITMEDYPTVVTIHPDGRFEASLPLFHPIRSGIVFDKASIPFYIEPGQTLAIWLDWEDFLKADRFRNRQLDFEIEYAGPAAFINHELMRLNLQAKKLPELSRKEMYQKMSELSPDDYKTYVTSVIEEYSSGIEKILEEENISPYTQTLARNNIKILYAQFLLDLDMNNKYRIFEGKEPYEMPSDFFDFLQYTPLNDCFVLATKEYDTFINRLEFCTPFDAQSSVYKRVQPQKSFSDYLFDELGIVKTQEDEEYIRVSEVVNKNINSITQEEITKYNELYQALFERHSSYSDDYTNKYVNTVEQLTQDEIRIAQWQIKDSIYSNVLKLQPGLSYDICKIRSLNHLFGEVLSEQEGYRILEWIKKDISNEFLVNEAIRLYETSYRNTAMGYELPAGDKGAELFKSMIDPFQGKYVFVDFWGTFCGPCIHGIKEMKETRRAYENSEDVVFLFITSESESPLDKYNEFIEEQELSHTYRVSSDEYLCLRQLFRFNGIPRYVLVGREGRILNEKFSMHNFEHELERLLAKKRNNKIQGAI
ncbi:MAG: TlpA family protein disulfide reductase, partial [Bacteroides sp.]|nr:TlpA family protein disulfide reductase [Bacteroides sp.]